MKYIDLHCDSLLIHAKTATRGSLFESPDSAIDIKKLCEAKAMAQFFAIFMLPFGTYDEEGIPEMTDDEYIQTLAGYLKAETINHPELISLTGDLRGMLKNDAEHRVSAFLTLEDGRAVNGSLERIKYFYDMGVRLIGFTWNFENCFGYPNSKNAQDMALGLKPFGFEAIELMNELGMIIDVSHLNDGGFYDVAKHSKKPFIASHSNARELSAHPRNLTDDMIKTVANAGGVIGLNFCPPFLVLDSHDSRVEDMIRHLKYIKNVGGADVLAIGSDLDGIGGNLEVASPLDFDMLFDRVRSAGFSADEVEKLAWKNAARMIGDVL